jgi:septum site-determining protein MinC
MSNASSSVFQIKSASMAMVALVLGGAKTEEILVAMKSALSGKSGFFENEAAVLDLSAIEGDVVPNFKSLVKEAGKYGLRVVAVKGGSPAQLEAAFACGLSDGRSASVGLGGLKDRPQPKTAAKSPATEQVAAASPSQGTGWLPPLVVEGPLRAGQTVYAQGRDLIVMSGVNAGAEVIADGSVHVYGALRGRALAGANGFDKATIFAHSLEAELVAVAGIFETAEGDHLSDLKGRSVLVTLKTTSPTKEGAVSDGHLAFKNLSAPNEVR